MSKPKPETQAALGMVHVSRESMQKLQQYSITAKTLGLQEMFDGGALVSIELGQQLKEDLVEAAKACEDPEGKAGLANAFANIVKSEASTRKVINDQPVPQAQKRRGKSYAPAAPIDVNPKTE